MTKLEPSIDYLAKDYESFKQLMLDRLSVTLPAWKERHAPDIGITIVEALAYVADYLSYYQDAVATEAYLGTARQRISIRRHARLLDYVLHEGCNARAWVHCEVKPNRGNKNKKVTIEKDEVRKLAFLAPRGRNARSSWPTNEEELSNLPASTCEVFKPVSSKSIHLNSNFNKISVIGPLETDATGVMVQLEPGADLEAGSVLIFKATKPEAAEVLYHPVALTKSVAAPKSVYANAWISWHFDDAIPRELGGITDVVALGNIVLVDHGQWVSDGASTTHSQSVSTPTDLKVWQGRVGPLQRPGLTHRSPMSTLPLSASAMMTQEPRQAVPDIRLTIDGASWQVRQDLLESFREDCHFCAEVDDNGFAWLRFGDGLGGGERPVDGLPVTARYRIGNGGAGNVPADAITRMIPPLDYVTVTNPIKAMGGVDPESAASVSLTAPGAMHVLQERAVCVEDYAEFARAVRGVANAAATMRREGARKIVCVAIDPQGRQTPGKNAKSQELQYWAGLRERVTERLEGVRRINHEVIVTGPDYVELKIGIRLTILPNYMPELIERQAKKELCIDRDDPQSKAFFHPDNLTFGQPVHWSRIVSRLHSIQGVMSAEQLCFARKDACASYDPEMPVAKIEIGPNEIVGMLFCHSDDFTVTATQFPCGPEV